MEAKDTVMSDEQLGEASWGKWNASHLRVVEAQSEISFKAGQQWVWDEGIIQQTFDEGKKKGIREVVEWIDGLIIGVDNCKFEERLDGDKGCIVLDMNENQWQAQKKEWGIDED